MKKVEKQIIEVLDKLKPYLRHDGGDIEFVKFEEGIVYVRFLGACENCPMLDHTLKEGIERALVETIKEVNEVVRI